MWRAEEAQRLPAKRRRNERRLGSNRRRSFPLMPNQRQLPSKGHQLPIKESVPKGCLPQMATDGHNITTKRNQVTPTANKPTGQPPTATI